MKLKYLVETDDQYLFVNGLDDLASHYKISLPGIRYRMKHKLININKIDTRLQDLNYEYIIDKNGVVIVDKPVVDKSIMDKLVDKNTVDKSVDNVLDKQLDKLVDKNKALDKSLKVVPQTKSLIKSRSIKYVLNERCNDQ